MGDRIFEFQSEIRGERDTWYEVMKNSRRTSRDIKHSITGKPRNICRLNNFIEKDGMNKLKDICDSEKDKIISNYKQM